MYVNYREKGSTLSFRNFSPVFLYEELKEYIDAFVSYNYERGHRYRAVILRSLIIAPAKVTRAATKINGIA